jgi:ribosomal protein L7/L12
MDDMQMIQRLAALEAQVLLLSQHVGVPCPTFASTGPQFGHTSPLDPLGEVAALAREGRKIDAIKRYRELTGADLGEAKRAVEAM